jgi:hypothetical protein
MIIGDDIKIALGDRCTYIFSPGNVYGSGTIIDTKKYGEVKRVEKFEKII